METLTQNTVEESPSDFLAQGLANIPGIDTAGYRTQPKSDENTALKTETQDRGTDEPDTQNQTEASNEVTDEASTSTSKAEVQPEKGKARSQNRIQELLAKIKQYEAKIEENEKAKVTPEATKAFDAPKPVENPAMIPKPEYTADVLKALLKKKQNELDEHVVNGDLPNIRATREMMESISEKLQEAQTWEARNKSAIEQYNATANQYRQQVLEKWPDMAKETSPIRQEYGKVHARFMELQKNPALFEYEMASIANLRTQAGLHASKVDVLEKQVKQLQQENASLKEKTKPLSQTEATSSESSNENEDPMAILRRGLREHRVKTLR